ncbi:hypothetical protein AMTRI_Chr05g74220 [Amborella trichopoda]
MAFVSMKRAMVFLGHEFTQKRWNHFSISAPLSRAVDLPFDNIPEDLGRFNLRKTPFLSEGNSHYKDLCPKIEAPNISPFGSIQLMAVPKKKVTPHKKRIRNGPKALKPVPVIMRCKSCGRVKLPHFFCCSGDRGTN